MVESFANQLALKLNTLTGNKNIAVDFVRYRIAELLHTMIIFLVAILISIFTGKTIEVIIALIAFGGLRIHSGGFHLKSLEACEVFTVLIVTTISLSHTEYVHAVNAIALGFIVIFNKKHLKYRVISYILISINFIIGNDIIAISFLAQSLTLIRFEGR